MMHEDTAGIKKSFFTENMGKLIFIASILAVIVTGIVYRSTGIYNDLWMDEASWAQKLINKPLISMTKFRPIGFMAATKGLLNINNNEFTLRLIPYVSSIFTIFLTYLVAKEIFKSKITVFLSVFIVSFNPLLISFAKEFKPYSEELFLHLLVILFILYFVKRKAYLKTYHIIGISLIALPFAYNIVFLYPSVFLILLLAAYEEKKVKEYITLICIGCLCLGALIAGYFIFWSHFTGTTVKIYWGQKYDVFFLSDNALNHVKWFIKKYAELIWASGRAEVMWDFFPIKYDVSSRISFLTDTVNDIIINVVLLITHSIGLAYLIFKKKIKYLLIFVLPVILVIFFNLLGTWPFGPFRTNLFLFCYFLIISLYGIDVIINTANRRFNLYASVFMVIILILLQLPFKPEYYKVKKGNRPDIKSILNTISDMGPLSQGKSLNKQPRVIIAEDASYQPIKYYLESHSELSEKYKEIRSDYKILYVIRMREINKLISTELSDYVKNGEPVWIVNSNPGDINMLGKYLVMDNIRFHKIFEESELIKYDLPGMSNIFTLDHESGFKGIEGMTEMDMKNEMVNGKEVLIARTTGKSSCFELKSIEFPKDKFLAISAQIKSPAWTDFRVYYMTESEKQYTESNSVSIWTNYGNNTLTAMINEMNIYGKIRICPGMVAGVYEISEIKIDAVNKFQ